MKKLTQEQEEMICYVIGDWYLKWRNCIADYDKRTHWLGRAKEDLKNMICEFNKKKET